MAKVIVEVSARHCHLSRQHLNKLFGEGHELTPLKPLSQTGQFAAQETLILRTGAGEIKNLRILGPARSETQIELSLTDARQLKINPPLRLSGDIKNSAGGVLIGPAGQIKIKSGIIIARRHLHCDPKTAERLKLKSGKDIRVRVKGDRALIFERVAVRVHPDFNFRFQIDTDEGNAAGLVIGRYWGEIIK